ncbi:MAG: sigma 54-interacting transcriptional regulator [Deltaproteobacteria bacterium]
MALTFDSLAEVVLARDLLRRWWDLELGLVEPGGNGYDRWSHATCATLMQTPPGACAGSMREAAALAAKTKGAIVHRCHAGLTIVAAAVRGGDGKVAGIAYSSGGRHGVPVADVTARIATETGAVEAPAMAAVAPELDDNALARIRDLVTAAAAACERAQPAIIPPTTFVHPFTEIVGDAPAVREVVKLLTKVVRSEATVLVHGESGTGKELIARAIHYHGPRGKKPFVVQNCSAFNDNLLESALFGHVRGAFTGAVKDQKGLFEVADGGTFFLDEIGDMSAALQVKLLRVLQEGTFMPVGGTKPVRVDVRIVAASHKDLQSMVQHKQFREDLFYRVNVLKITVPPLRERVADIPRLVNHFLKKHTPNGTPPRLSAGALARIVAYPWPGNIRELENEIERMLVLAAGATELTASMVSTRVAGAAIGTPRPLRDVVDIAEADAIVAALGRHGGDRDAAAAELGVSPGYLDARRGALGLRTE